LFDDVLYIRQKAIVKYYEDELENLRLRKTHLSG